MLLERNTFFVKEQIEFLKLAGTYELLDPESGRVIGVAREEPGTFIKFLRLVVSKLMLPTRVNVYDASNEQVVVSIEKPVSFIRSKVMVHDSAGTLLGYFRSKVLTLGGGFWVFGPDDRQVAEIKGDWKGWNFRLVDVSGRELGTVTKKWAGLGKELFTSADNYIIALADDTTSDKKQAALLLAAGLAIDIIFKEKA